MPPHLYTPTLKTRLRSGFHGVGPVNYPRRGVGGAIALSHAFCTRCRLASGIIPAYRTAAGNRRRRRRGRVRTVFFFRYNYFRFFSPPGQPVSVGAFCSESRARGGRYSYAIVYNAVRSKTKSIGASEGDEREIDGIMKTTIEEYARLPLESGAQSERKSRVTRDFR